MKAFLMAGQSNMAGRGNFEDVPVIQNEHCFMLRNGLWEPMHEPVNPDAPFFPVYDDLHSGISLAAKFAELYAETYHEDVGLIPCAHGGTLASQWMPGEILFDHAVFQTKLASRTSEVIGILWHQGEQDSVNEKDAGAHKDKTRTILKALQNEVGNGSLPVIVGQLGHFIGDLCPYFETVNAGLEELCAAEPTFGFVRADGLTPKHDGVHFDAVSCREFGRRYFEVYRSLREASR